jgi:CheY-like chemotaxis protein
MGGTIRVESRLGEGSTFSFDLSLASCLPEASAPAPTPLLEKPKPSAIEPVEILLVEDNLTNQKVALSILRRLGHAAEVANNGCEAVAAVARKQYDLIFMDVHMPQMDGFTATAQIREMPLGKHPRIVALTADVLKGEREKCLGAGMDDFCTKPIKIDDLRQVISELGSRQNGSGQADL